MLLFSFTGQRVVLPACICDKTPGGELLQSGVDRPRMRNRSLRMNMSPDEPASRSAA
jgi:hypothetical protein